MRESGTLSLPTRRPPAAEAHAATTPVDSTIETAYERAFAADPVSAFGMVCVLNRPVEAELAWALAERFIDVLFAPGYADAALEALKEKPNTRILLDRERRHFDPGEKDYK